MAQRKKKVAKKTTKRTTEKSNGSMVEGPRFDDDGGLYFSKMDLAVYELAQHRVVTLDQAIVIKKNEALGVKREAEDRIANINAEIASLASQRTEQQKQLKVLQDAVAEKYEIDLSKVSYSDETGRISIEGEPVIRQRKP